MPLRTFTLHIDQDELGEPRRIEFNGEDPHLAFGILEREGVGRVASIYEGTKLLGQLQRVGRDFWELR